MTQSTAREPRDEPRYDWLVFIGRFQPFHRGHLAVVQQALQQAPRVLLLIGSANRPRSIRDPFTYEERAGMIRACLSPADNARLQLAPLDDALYNDARWIGGVQRAVHGVAGQSRIGLIGHAKDHSSYYLKQFPGWGAIDVPNHEAHSATEIRRTYFAADATAEWIDARLPEPVRSFMQRFAAPYGELIEAALQRVRKARGVALPKIGERLKPAELDELRERLPQLSSVDSPYATLLSEARYVERFRAEFAGLKYPPTFSTVDAVVVQSGHVLLVRRGIMPGKGQIALPGGFIAQDEPALDACIRELREETRLKVPEPVLRGSLTGREFFDDPHRSVRGRTFTMAFRFELRAERELPKVKGGDDARDAFWLPLGLLDPKQMFEDHYFILQQMLGI